MFGILNFGFQGSASSGETGTAFVRRDGTLPLLDNWNAGAYGITANTFTANNGFVFNVGQGGTLISESTTGTPKTWTLPNTTGTIALISDIPSPISVKDENIEVTNALKSLNFTGENVSATLDGETVNVSIGGVSSVGLTMPSAFAVSNSPITSSGDIIVSASGLSSQYIRGDGQLANFPTSIGGGSTVNYYLNGGTSQGSFGGVTYYQMSETADTSTATNFVLDSVNPSVSFITDVNIPDELSIPNGSWILRSYFSQSTNIGQCHVQGELYKYNGVSFTLISTGAIESITNGTTPDLYTYSIPIPTGVTLTRTDRLAIKITASNFLGKSVTLYTQDSKLAQIQTTYSKGLNTLNGLTDQVQYFQTGTSGTSFNINSVGDTHTFNLPIASSSNTGVLSSSDWTTFNNKGNGDLLANGSVPLTANWNVGAYGITANTFTANNGFTFNIGQGGILVSESTTGSAKTWTLPNNTGTIALTTDIPSLSGYLKSDGSVGLTANWNAGAYGITANTFTANNGFTFNIGQGGTLVSASTTGSAKTWTLPNNTGTIALTSDITGTISSFTTNGYGGVATFSGGVLNIPNYASSTYDINKTPTSNAFVFNCNNVMQELDISSATGTVSISFSNISEGYTYTMILKQGSTPRNLSFPSAYWLNDTAPYDFSSMTSSGRALITMTRLNSTWYIASKTLTLV